MMWADVSLFLTAVGLLPIAVSGADIDQIDGGSGIWKKGGAGEMISRKNDAMQYAADPEYSSS